MVIDTIEVENINCPGTSKNVNRKKYVAMRELLLDILPETPPGMTAREMVEAIEPKAPQKLWPEGQKLGWWQKTVQLDLEAKKLILRDAKSKPLRWWANPS